MQIADNISAYSGEALSTRKRRESWKRTGWAVLIAFSVGTGAVSGLAGLALSFLAAEAIVDPSSYVKFLVPVLIVLSLSLLMLAAHAMDRLQQAAK